MSEERNKHNLIKMTESKIFEIVLQTQKQYDFPKLHSEAVSTISASFTDIIYDTLKLKSSLASSRRLNVLKFLNRLSSRCDIHININETNYHNFIVSCQHDGCGESLDKINSELEEQTPKDLYTEIQRFYSIKNEKQQKGNKKRELIKKCDQEALAKAAFLGRIQRNISYYETNQNIIHKLIPTTVVLSTHTNTVDVADFAYREKQVKFAYALLHLQEWTLLIKVLDRLVTYKNLSKSEIHFLNYLNENLPTEDQNLQKFLIKSFPFIYEKPIINFCTTIIQTQEDRLLDYFGTLLFNKEFVIIRKMCIDESFRLKLKILLCELYTYSFCNPNILKFFDFLL